MRFASYLKDGKATFGMAVGEGLVTLAGRIPGIDSLKAAIAADALGRLAQLGGSEKPDAATGAVTFLSPIPGPDKIFGMGLNYAAHAAEAGRETSKDAPVLFFRLPETMRGHGQPILRPKVSTHYDFEGELAVIIGRGGRHIPVKDALQHVAGYSCFMDGSVRDFQKRSLPSGKNFENSGACGPWLVTPDEAGDVSKLMLTTYLNGQVVQHSGIDNMIHTVAELIAYFSQIVSVAPGDIIATGTPAGVGATRQPPLWLKAGDVVTVEIPGIGTLSNPVADEV